MLYARSGRVDEATGAAAELEEYQRREGDHGHARSYVAAVRAEIAIQRGDTLAALLTLDEALVTAWYLDALQSALYSHAPARYRRAELLDALGRTDEALRWYGTFDEGSTYDVPYRGPAEVRLAELLESSGRTGEAAYYFERVAELLREAEGPYAELAQRARAGLERTRPN